MAKSHTISTTLKCNVCANVCTIHRKKCRQKKSGHTKHMYCWQCQEVHPFTEMKEYEADMHCQYWITYHLNMENMKNNIIVAESTL